MEDTGMLIVNWIFIQIAFHKVVVKKHILGKKSVLGAHFWTATSSCGNISGL